MHIPPPSCFTAHPTRSGSSQSRALSSLSPQQLPLAVCLTRGRVQRSALRSRSIPPSACPPVPLFLGILRYSCPTSRFIGPVFLRFHTF